MKFPQALLNYTPKQQIKIVAFLNDWGSLSLPDYVAVDNIQNEHFMEAAAWDAFFKELLEFDKQKKKAKNKKVFFIHFKYYLYQVFREKFLLCGGLVSAQCQPQMVGIVLPYDQFIHHLLIHYPQYFTEPEEVSRRIYNMENLSSMYPHLLELVIKKSGCLLWLVWDKEGTENGPFRNKKLDREMLRNRLGLGGRYFEGKSLLAFVFECNYPIFCPTFSDSNLSVYFKPYHEDHGMTKPLYQSRDNRKKRASESNGMPEGVHLSDYFQMRLLKQLNFYY